MLQAIVQKQPELAALCVRHGVARLEVFGSAATGAFSPGESDFDFLVEFAPGGQGGLFDRYFGLKEDLERLLGGAVDLVMVTALKSPFFIEAVSKTRRLLYAA